MPPGRDSFRRNRVAPVHAYFSILACRIPGFRLPVFADCIDSLQLFPLCKAPANLLSGSHENKPLAHFSMEARSAATPMRGSSQNTPSLACAHPASPGYPTETVTPTMPPRFELATLADLESLLSLMEKMQEADPWSEPFCETTLRFNLAQLLQNSTFGMACLVWNSERPIAYLVICFDYSLEYRGKGAWIDELFVEASHRGRGIGTGLLDLAETLSREHHAQFLHLEVSHGNPAIELYRRRGYVEHHRYLMTKPLTS
jgi:GNAT superfamily N-acetyltransferase